MTDDLIPPAQKIREGGQTLTLVHPLDRSLAGEKRRELSLDTFRQLEEELFNESGQVVHAALAFGEIEPEHYLALKPEDRYKQPPEEWVAEFGLREARKRLRIALSAWCDQKSAPVGLKMAQATYIGISRVRAGDKMSQGATLNIAFIDVPRPIDVYPEQEVEDRK